MIEYWSCVELVLFDLMSEIKALNGKNNGLIFPLDLKNVFGSEKALEIRTLSETHPVSYPLDFHSSY